MTRQRFPEVASITFDCVDPVALARFWSAALRRPLGDEASPDMASVDGQPPWTFMAVPEPKTVKNRVHLDIRVDDLSAAVERLVELGARRAGEFKEGGFHWVTLADPEGNEFDVAVEV